MKVKALALQIISEITLKPDSFYLKLNQLSLILKEIHFLYKPKKGSQMFKKHIKEKIKLT
jgi:hypothetical protein